MPYLVRFNATRLAWRFHQLCGERISEVEAIAKVLSAPAPVRRTSDPDLYYADEDPRLLFEADEIGACREIYPLKRVRCGDVFDVTAAKDVRKRKR